MYNRGNLSGGFAPGKYICFTWFESEIMIRSLCIKLRKTLGRTPNFHKTKHKHHVHRSMFRFSLPSFTSLRTALTQLLLD